MRIHRLCTYWILFALLVACTSVQSPIPAINSSYATAHLAFFVDSGDSRGFFSKDLLYVADLATSQTQLVASVYQGPFPGHSCAPPVWSPDGKWLALGEWNGECYQEYSIVDCEQGKVWNPGTVCGWGGFKKWTPDSRYVVFSCYGSENSASAAVFDVLEKKQSGLPVKPRDWFVPYRWGPVAISPVSPTLLLQNGSLTYLPDLSSTVVYSYVHKGAWSPDGSLLAFIGCQAYLASCALYLAKEDGANIQRIIEVPPTNGPVLWTSDAQSVTFWGKPEKYVLDVQQQQVRVLPVREEEELPWPSRALCGNISSFFEEDTSPVKEVTTACWSPDEALLAVGGANTLRVYDSRFRLLHSFPVTGTVGNIAWSPVP